MLGYLTRSDIENARASHAIRSASSESGPFRIDSANLKGLFDRPLPNVNAQINNLLKWVHQQDPDDPLRAVELPRSLSDLAGYLGTPNGDRVDRVISMAASRGLIDLVPDDCVQLTWTGVQQIEVQSELSGFREAESAAAQLTAPVKERSPSEPVESVMADCPKCRGARNSEVVARHQKRWEHEFGAVWSLTNYRILRCKGCDEVFFQEEFFFSEDAEMEQDSQSGEWHEAPIPKITYWPPPVRRQRPDWLLEIKDQSLRDLLDEVYLSIDHNLLTVAAMGVRAVLDKTFELAGAAESDSFRKKIETLAGGGKVSADQAAILLTVTDAGSAAVHRGWRPDQGSIDSLIDVTEHLLHLINVLEPAAKQLRQLVPARPGKGPAAPP